MDEIKKYMKFGLSGNTLNSIINELKMHREVESALIFGSRAKMNFKQGSDVDIALTGDLVSNELAWQISGKLNEELPLPYSFDVVAYSGINTVELKEHIDRVGIVLYSR